MGNPEVQAKNRQQNEQYITDSLKKNIQSCIDAKNMLRSFMENMGSLLAEEYTFTDNNGVTRTISGSIASKEDKAKGIYGTLDIFELPEYKAQPFEEVSRNMESHFKMYCLINGITDEEMLSVAKSKPAGPLREKLLSLKAKFFDMVANKKMSAIEDYYVGIANYMENKLPKFMQCDSFENLDKYTNDMFLILGTTSYLQQTLRLNGYRNNSKAQTDLFNNVNKKLAAQGKKYTLQTVEKTVYPFDFYISSLCGDELYDDNVKVDPTLSYKKIKNQEYFQDKLVPQKVSSKATGLIKCVKEIKQKAFEKGCDYNKTFQDYDAFAEINIYVGVITAKEIYNDTVNEFRLPFDDHTKNFQYIATELTKSKTFIKAPKDENIIKLMALIDETERTINDNPDTAKLTDYEKLADAYVNLKELCDKVINDETGTYLDNEILLAHQIKSFANKALDDPKLGMIVTAKENYLGAIKEAIAAANKNEAIDNTIRSILREPLTHKDSKGTVRVIVGDDNDPEKNTLGIVDIFEDPEFKGQPFLEVSRNMFSHFRMYCLVNGITPGELMSLENPEVKPALKQKLLNLKHDFFDMVIEKDLNRISDMYVKIFEMVNNDKNDILKLTPGNGQFIKEHPELLIKYHGSQSWYSQSLDHEGIYETDKGKELVKMINTKLADKKLGFTFNQVNVPIQVCDNIDDGLQNIAKEELNYKAMKHKGKPSFQLSLVNGWISYLQNGYAKSKHENPDANWIGAFPDDQHKQMEAFTAPEINDRNAFLKYAYLYNEDSDFGAEFRKTTEPFATYNKYPRINEIGKKTVNSLKAAMEKATKTIRKNKENPDPKSLAIFITANNVLLNPELVKGNPKFSSVVGKINQNAALAAFNNLNEKEREEFLNFSNKDLYQSFMDDYQYNIEISNQKYKEAELNEEDRALAQYYSKPAKDIYVTQQKILGGLIEKQKQDPENIGKHFSEHFQAALSNIISAKQTETYIKENFKNLSDEQISNLTSKKAIHQRALAILKSENFSKLAMEYIKPEKYKELAIGIEHLFNKDEAPIMATTEISEKAVKELVEGFEKENHSVKDISVENPNAQKLMK